MCHGLTFSDNIAYVARDFDKWFIELTSKWFLDSGGSEIYF